jgi:phosphoserine aminotransferase
MRIFNFSPGPAVLPEEVLRTAAAEMLDGHGSGMSVMEMSHRGKEFISIADQAQADLRGLLAIPDNYKVLFLQGGAIGENAIVPMNLFHGRTVADYVHTGEWSKKSIKEAKKYGTVNVAASSEDKAFTYIPTARRGSSPRMPPTCTFAATRRSAASSTSGRRIPATSRWLPTRRRISCRG